MNENSKTQFEDRFQRVVSKKRLISVVTACGWTALALCVCFAIVAILDYFFETGWSFRAILFVTALVAAVAIVSIHVFRVRHQWKRQSTAADVEGRFQDLGQSIRTSIQLNDEGPGNFSPDLHKALNESVGEQTRDLRLGEAVSTGPLKIAVALLGLMMILVCSVCASSQQWRLAAYRTFLGDHPYTTIEVDQGDVRVDEKATFTLDAEVAGRINRDVVLMTRESDAAEDDWRMRELTNDDAIEREPNRISFQVEIPKVKKPFDYRLVAGKYSTPVHHVDVRYPLAVEGFHIELTMPEYTGLRPRVIDKGSFAALQGTKAKFEIEIDHPPSKAWMEVRPPVTPRGEEPKIEIVELDIDGTKLSTERDLESDCFYRVFAELPDGTSLRRNRYRIRVRADRAPRLTFDKPSPLVEVHSLAELFMKLRVSDDFGLKRAGIVFQVNDDPEIVLEEKEFEAILSNAGKEKPKIKSTIETLLPLEYFRMTVKDSVSYYAFAEDNRPGEANRNETDLHFIDVRAFRRTFAIPQGNNSLSGMGRGREQTSLPALDEMIGRERFVLNRTVQMKRSAERNKRIDASIVDGLIKLQNETSEFAGMLGDRAVQIEERFGIPEEGRISDQMYQAQEAMLASVDSLSGAEYEVASLQEKEALRYLIDARQVLENAVSGKSGSAALAELRNFSRMMFRRMNRPNNDEERAREITRRLQQASAQQRYLMEEMSDLVPPDFPKTEDGIAEDVAVDSEEDENAAAEETLAEQRHEVEEAQTKLGDEIEDIVRMIDELAQVSELVKTRAGRAGELVEGVSDSLSKDKMDQAVEIAGQASVALRVLAENVAGVTANESTKRLGAARDLSMAITDELRGLASQLESTKQNAEKKDASADELVEREEDVAAELAKVAETQGEVAETVLDILDSIIDPEKGIIDSEDKMVKRIQELKADNKLEQSVTRAQSLHEVINTLVWNDAEVSTSDLAERFDIVSQRLDAMHRELLSPRIEQLTKLEERAVEAKQKLQQMQSEDQVSRWHERAEGLADDIDAAEIAKKPVNTLREVMADAGWGSEASRNWNWETDASGAMLKAPKEYASSLDEVIEEIKHHIRELSIADAEFATAGGVPPKYEHFVERYWEVLAGAIDQPNEQ
jgi:hypothetical protein